MSGRPLTLEERYLIQAGWLAGLGMAAIGAQLRRHRSVIDDEIKRGRDDDGNYCPHLAQRKREEAKARSAANSVGKPAAVWAAVEAKLKQAWTPEQISGRWKLLGAKQTLSIPAIYAGAKRFGWESYLHRHRLRAHLKRPARRPWSGSARSIRERSEEANLRIEAGHWEADSMIGKRSDRKRVVQAVERQSLYWELLLVKGAKSQTTVRALKRRLSANGLPLHSITTDRGSEFHATGDVFGRKAMVCDSYAPNQRATNENQIGVLRAHLPKGHTLDHLTASQLRSLQNAYNNRPRKCLGFLTPYEVAFNRLPRVGTRT